MTFANYAETEKVALTGWPSNKVDTALGPNFISAKISQQQWALLTNLDSGKMKIIPWEQSKCCPILSIPPLIPARFCGFQLESRNSAEFQEFQRILAGINRNPNGIDINSPHILHFYFRNVLEEGNWPKQYKIQRVYYAKLQL